MNKSELINHISEDADISKAAAARALNSFIDNIGKSITKGQTVSLIGFGTFSQKKRAARAGRNPQTGVAIKIAAAKVVKFTPGKALKDRVNKR